MCAPEKPSGDNPQPATFPDLDRCSARRSTFGGWVDCLSEWAARCPHSISLGESFFCRHPEVAKILGRLEGEERG